jgi:hypothetical protein
MTPTEERIYLAEILKLVDSGAPKALQSSWTGLALWISAAAIFFAIFVAGNRVHPLVSLGISAFVGIAIGAFTLAKLAAKQWPYLRHHVNRESVAGRLSELEP